MNKQENEIKRWTAKRKTQVVLDILKGKTTVAEVSRQHDLTPGEVERWVDEGIRGMENNFRVRPRDIREQYERKLAQAHAALGEKELALKAVKKLQRLRDEEEI
jgi:transposase-like protein